MERMWITASDGDLLDRAQHEPKAFAAFYLRYEPLVVRYLSARGLDAETVADLTSDTFESVVRRAHTYVDNGMPAAGWVLGVARRILLMHRRRERGRSAAIHRAGAESAVKVDARWSNASLERVGMVASGAADSALLEGALNELAPEQREAVWQVVVGEVPYAELAERLGSPEATVRKRVSRGLARLRTQLEGRL